VLVDPDRRRPPRPTPRRRRGPRQQRTLPLARTRSDEWRAGIEWATLDLSASYRAVFDTMLPDAVQVADPFHVVKLANQRSMSAGAGCRTRPSGIGAASTIRSTEPAAGW
jgi:transposase